jgi:cathepsin L
MRALIVAVLFVSAVLALRCDNTEFLGWTNKHGKVYSATDLRGRFAVWTKNCLYINSANKRQLNYTVAMNSFGDLTGQEFAKFFTGLKMNTTTLRQFQSGSRTVRSGLPASFNWATQGAVTPIKNQQQCGSCWSFSTTGSVEGCHFLGAKKLVSLSEQNLMDCSWSQGNQGCNGGLMTQAMQYIISNGGIDTESSYPYTAEDGTCNYQASNSGSTLTAFTNVASGDENALQTSVYSGPTSVAIDASQSSFQFYSSGVYSDPACSSTQLDHGVLSVGWGVSGSSPYWIVKNSWGTDWGQSGYIWMARNDNNMCGIATMATLPTGCS